MTQQFCPNCRSEDVSVFEEETRIECNDCGYKGKMIIIPKNDEFEEQEDKQKLKINKIIKSKSRGKKSK